MTENKPSTRPPEDDAPVRKQKKKLSWKSVVGTAVAIIIVWQLVHVFVQSQGKAGKQAPSTSIAPPAKPNPVRTVTLGGRRVAAGGGPVVTLNPGLVGPGGQVGVNGSGFAARTQAVVSLRAAHLSAGKVVAHGRTTASGTLTTGFTMPTSMSGSKATVVVQAGGVEATAPLVTPGGMGTATIVGKAAGKPGDTVSVDASGFGPGEKVNVFWGRINGTPAATLTADSSGSVGRASVPVGIAPVGPTTLVLVGARTHTTATAPYQMLGLYPGTSTKPYAAKAGKTVTFSGNGFAPNEPVLVFLNASNGTPALTVNTDSTGGFSVDFALPFGLRGSQELTAVGEESRASVTSGFDVLPYNPSAQASTYGALPGTTLTFYVSGFAANEVVLVYAGGGSAGGQLVTAFRVNGQGSASSAGQYVVPSGVGPGLSFRLVGQKSGGTAKAKVSVTAPSQPVTVPPQKPYVLPPSLGGKPVPSKTPAKGSKGASPSRKASSHP